MTKRRPCREVDGVGVQGYKIWVTVVFFKKFTDAVEYMLNMPGTDVKPNA